MTTYELRDKEVVNICDGARLGCPSDFEFNAADGRISALIVPKSVGVFSFFHGEEIIIPWSKIECIGSDAILVRLTNGEMVDKNREKKRNNL